MLQGPRPPRGLYKPPGLPRYDPTRAMRGTVFSCVFDNACTNLVTGTTPPPRSGGILYAPQPTANGQGRITQYASVTWDVPQVAALPMSLQVVFTYYGADSSILWGGSSGYIGVTANKIYCQWWRGNWFTLSGATTLISGQTYVGAMVVTSTTVRLYLNGVLDGSNTTTTLQAANGTVNLSLDTTLSVSVLYAEVANVQWSDVEIDAQSSPYDALIWPEDDLWMSLVGVGGAVSWEASALLSGAGTLTSSASLLEQASAVLSGQGSAALIAAIGVIARAELDGVGYLAGTSSGALAARGILSGSGDMSAAATLAEAASALLAGRGDLSADPFAGLVARAELAGNSALIANSIAMLEAMARLDGMGFMEWLEVVGNQIADRGVRLAAIRRGVKLPGPRD